MALAPAEAEVRLLSSLANLQDLQVLQDHGVTSESFLLYGEVLDYVQEFARLYQTLPRKDDVEARFRGTDQELELGPPGTLEYYTAEVAKLHLSRTIRDSIRQRAGDDGVNIDRSPEETARLIAQDLQQLQHQRSRNVAWLDRDALERYNQLQERLRATSEGQVLGIPTGLRCFDDHQEGWQSGEAVMVIGPKGSGKSWVLMKFATKAYAHGARVLFFSPEMSWEECALRFDVILAREYHREWSHTQLRTGTTIDLEEYKEWLEGLTARSDFICVDSVDARGFTLAGMLGAISEFQPDVVCLDGIHLVKGPQGDAGWEVIKEAADGLKADAQRRKTVVLWVGQVDREGMKNASEPVNSGAQAAYGKAAVESANRLITLGADSDDPFQRVFKVPNNRSGREWHLKQTLYFDVDRGIIEQREVEEPLAFGTLADGKEI